MTAFYGSSWHLGSSRLPIRLRAPSRQEWGVSHLHPYLKGSQMFVAQMTERVSEMQVCKSKRGDL